MQQIYKSAFFPIIQYIDKGTCIHAVTSAVTSGSYSECKDMHSQKIGRGQESFLVEQLLEADINAAFHLRNKYIREINAKRSC